MHPNEIDFTNAEKNGLNLDVLTPINTGAEKLGKPYVAALKEQIGRQKKFFGIVTNTEN